MRGLRDLPFLVILMGIGAAAMLIPAVHAAVIGQFDVGRAFLYSALLLLVLTGMIAIAAATYRPRSAARSHLAALIGAYLVLPPLLALPLWVTEPAAGPLAAWFEMVASLTTTGATLYPAADLAAPVHLWRALVGWLGGAFILVSAATILAPLNLGGFEVLSPRRLGQGEGTAAAMLRGATDPSDRLWHYSLRLAPVYGGLTAVLAAGLVMVGERPFVAICHAMAVLSTSAISPIGGIGGDLGGSGGGIAAEALMLCGLALALTRRSLPGAVRVDSGQPPWADPELRLAAVLVAVVTLALFLRHWIGALGGGGPGALGYAATALWGTVFTVVSFLTTTGFISSGWDEAQVWSGMQTPGLILLGLAIMGGGVATTAGGVRLLRIHALYRLGRRELDRLSHPSMIEPARAVGNGQTDRRLRTEGAMVAFVFFMLFALALGVVTATLAIAGTSFEQGVVLAIAALTSAGPLAEAAGGISYGALSDAQQVILALAMIAGRIEVLVLLALLLPSAWRK